MSFTLDRLEHLAKMAEQFGCRLFVKDLRDFKILNSLLAISNFLNTTLKIFCPLDEAYTMFKKQNNRKLSQNIEEVIFDHVGKKVIGTSNNFFVSLSTKNTKMMIKKRLDTVIINLFVLFFFYILISLNVSVIVMFTHREYHRNSEKCLQSGSSNPSHTASYKVKIVNTTLFFRLLKR